jgi:hypothetical protein
VKNVIGNGAIVATSARVEMPNAECIGGSQCLAAGEAVEEAVTGWTIFPVFAAEKKKTTSDVVIHVATCPHQPDDWSHSSPVSKS